MAGEVKSAAGRFALRLTSSLAPLGAKAVQASERPALESPRLQALAQAIQRGAGSGVAADAFWRRVQEEGTDRKSTRLNSSHQIISYAVFCLKKKKEKYANHLA